MSRIGDAFTTARKANRAAFIAYFTAGDPHLGRTPEIAVALRRGGADVLEIFLQDLQLLQTELQQRLVGHVVDADTAGIFVHDFLETLQPVQG